MDKIEYSDTVKDIVATDILGRSFNVVKGFDSNKKVGIFYFFAHDPKYAFLDTPDIMDMDIDRIKDPTKDIGTHYWGKPIYGYYIQTEKWVMQKHVKLLSSIGVDYVGFDTTNLDSFIECANNYLDVSLELYKQGVNVPKVLFYTNIQSKKRITEIYQGLYNPNTENGKRFAPLWFTAQDANGGNKQGKPWIIGKNDNKGKEDDDWFAPKYNYSNLDKEILDFFYIKDSQWPNEPMIDTAVPWISWARTTDKNGRKQHNHNGIMSVSVAQHTAGCMSDTVLEGPLETWGFENYGRGYMTGKGRQENRVLYGDNFTEQWNNAINDKTVKNVFVTGWNEWIVGKGKPDKIHTYPFFVDQFNLEYSRDIEPMRGGYYDIPYLQLASNIRRFKGVKGKTEKAPGKTVDIFGSREQFNGTKGYKDCTSYIKERDGYSVRPARTHYVNKTLRNDIKEIRVTFDKDNLYFYVECDKKITAYDGRENWMNIFLSIDGKNGGWENYQYVINRKIDGNETAITKLDKDGSGKIVSYGKINVVKNYMMLEIPLESLGIKGTPKFNFKVSDNVSEYKDIMDYYENGDSVPMGRLNYHFEG